jgi:phospholipase/carboxylesterase
MISQSSAHARETPIFMAHGKEDFVVPYPLGQIAFDALKKAGFAASWQSYPIGHTVCAEEIQEISSWLQTIYT